MKVGDEIIHHQKLVFGSDIDRCRETVYFSSLFSTNIVDKIFWFYSLSKSIPEKYFLFIKGTFFFVAESFPEKWKRLKCTTYGCSYGNEPFPTGFHLVDFSKNRQWYLDLFFMDRVVTYIFRVERSECSESDMESDRVFWVFYF